MGQSETALEGLLTGSECHASCPLHVFPEPVAALFFRASEAHHPYVPTCDPRITPLCLFMCTAITHGWNISINGQRRAKSLSPSAAHVCNETQADNQCCAYWVTVLWRAGSHMPRLPPEKAGVREHWVRPGRHGGPAEKTLWINVTSHGVSISSEIRCERNRSHHSRCEGETHVVSGGACRGWEVYQRRFWNIA